MSKINFNIIETEQDLNTLTLVLYNHNDLKNITIQSGEIAKSNEYQCHYFALVRKEKYNNLTFNIVVPLVYYNYPQECSTATIDFKMEDVIAKAKELGKLAKLKYVLVKSQASKISPILENGKIDYQFTYFNNIHRHP